MINKKRMYILICCILVGIIFLIISKNKSLLSFSSLPITQEKKIPVIKGITYYVSPDGNDENDGNTEKFAFATLQRAVDVLNPGDGVILSNGVYFQDFITTRDGEKENLIVIKGSKNAIIKGSGEKDRIIEINHDYIALTGFTVDGFSGKNKNNKKEYRDKLVYMQGINPFSGITGIKIIDMKFTNAGGECIRGKYFFHDNEIAYNTITRCGVYDFMFNDGGKNGEGIYIGTAPEQINDDKNPTRDRDTSNNNWIHDNIIDTQGNECVDIKEGSSENLVENNSCTGQKDPESAGLDARGSNNIFSENEVFGNIGAGVRLGGDDDTDGINNTVINNNIHHNKNGGIKIQRHPQKQICGNVIINNDKDDIVGSYSKDNKNKRKCT